MSFGNEIRRRREAAQMTMNTLAGAVGVTEGMVVKWEASKHRPRRATAIKLDKALAAKGELLASLGYLPDERVSRPHVDAGTARRLQNRMTAFEQRLDDELATLRARLDAIDRRLASGDG